MRGASARRVYDLCSPRYSLHLETHPVEKLDAPSDLRPRLQKVMGILQSPHRGLEAEPVQFVDELFRFADAAPPRHIVTGRAQLVQVMNLDGEETMLERIHRGDRIDSRAQPVAQIGTGT